MRFVEELQAAVKEYKDKEADKRLVDELKRACMRSAREGLESYSLGEEFFTRDKAKEYYNRMGGILINMHAVDGIKYELKREQLESGNWRVVATLHWEV